MLRWLNAFVSKPGQTIPGVDDEMFDRIQVPTLIIRGGENDMDHPKRTSLEVSCLIKGSKLIDPPWPEDAWERASEERAAGKVKHFNMFDTWVQAAPAILEFLGSVMRLHRANVDLAVERRLQRRVDSAFRDALEVVLTQRHVHDVEAVVAGRPHDVAGEPEPGQHAVRVVVGPPADEGDHAGNRGGAEYLGAQLHCGFLGRCRRLQPAISSSTSRRPAGMAAEVVLDHVDTGRAREFEERCHAVS